MVRGLIWTGWLVQPRPRRPACPEAPPSPATTVALMPGRVLDAAPLTYTPPYLTEKILTTRPALEGERKQVTVLFADIKDSTELIADSTRSRPAALRSRPYSV